MKHLSRWRAITMLLGALSLAGSANAQGRPDLETLDGGVRQLYQSIRKNLVAAADLMPERDYDFRPTAEVRSFGQLVGHVTNTLYNFCAPVRPGVKPPRVNHETLAGKAALVAALREGVAFCDVAYDAVDAAALDAPTSFGSMPITKGYTLIYNIAHANEHYGNMVTYLRLKGLVPP